MARNQKRLIFILSIFVVVGIAAYFGFKKYQRNLQEIKIANILTDRLHFRGLNILSESFRRGKLLGFGQDLKKDQGISKCLDAKGTGCQSFAFEKQIVKDMFSDFNVALTGQGLLCHNPKDCIAERKATITLKCSSQNSCEKAIFDVETFSLKGGISRKSSVELVAAQLQEAIIAAQGNSNGDSILSAFIPQKAKDARNQKAFWQFMKSERDRLSAEKSKIEIKSSPNKSPTSAR